MADCTASLGHKVRSIQTMPVWTLVLLACVLLSHRSTAHPHQKATYKPAQHADGSYLVHQQDDANTVSQSFAQSQTLPDRLNPKPLDFWMAQQEFPVPFRARIPLPAKPRESVSPAKAPRRADQGPDVKSADPVGILEEDIEMLAAESGPTPTETIPLYECPSSYRETPDGDGTTFQIFDSGRWWTQNCQTGLEWDQGLCRCEYPPGTRWELDCRDFRSVPDGLSPNSFQQFVNGAWLTRDCSPSVAGLVWDQDSCRCVWGPGGPESAAVTSPCDVMLNMTFDDGVEDTAKGSFVEVGQGLPLPTRSDPQQRPRRGGNRAAYFTDTALNIWYFSDNDLGSSLRLEFRFLQDQHSLSRGNGGRARADDSSSVYQMFLSNGCNISTPGYMPPSVAIGYRASDQSYLLAFETSAVRKAIVCNRATSPGQWHSVSLLYEDGTLVMRVDGRPCIVSADFSGPIQKSPCPLTIGADPLDRQGMYRGYLDDLLIARTCQEPSEVTTQAPQLELESPQDPVAYRAKLVDLIEGKRNTSRWNETESDIDSAKTSSSEKESSNKSKNDSETESNPNVSRGTNFENQTGYNVNQDGNSSSDQHSYSPGNRNVDNGTSFQPTKDSLNNTNHSQRSIDATTHADPASEDQLEGATSNTTSLMLESASTDEVRLPQNVTGKVEASEITNSTETPRTVTDSVMKEVTNFAESPRTNPDSITKEANNSSARQRTVTDLVSIETTDSPKTSKAESEMTTVEKIVPTTTAPKITLFRAAVSETISQKQPVGETMKNNSETLNDGLAQTGRQKQPMVENERSNPEILNDGLAGHKHEDDRFPNPKGVNDILATHENEDERLFPHKGVIGRSAGHKHIKPDLSRDNERLTNHKEADDVSVSRLNNNTNLNESQSTEKTAIPLQSRGYNNRRRPFQTHKPSSDLYAVIRYRPPSKRFWYEFPSEAQPFVSGWSTHDRRRYRGYKARETPMIYPSRKHSRYYGKDVSRKSERRHRTAERPPKSRYLKERKRLPLLTMKRWYDL